MPKGPRCATPNTSVFHAARLAVWCRCTRTPKRSKRYSASACRIRSRQGSLVLPLLPEILSLRRDQLRQLRRMLRDRRLSLRRRRALSKRARAIDGAERQSDLVVTCMSLCPENWRRTRTLKLMRLTRGPENRRGTRALNLRGITRVADRLARSVLACLCRLDRSLEHVKMIRPRWPPSPRLPRMQLRTLWR